jgi:hypothetical protein
MKGVSAVIERLPALGDITTWGETAFWSVEAVCAPHAALACVSHRRSSNEGGLRASCAPVVTRAGGFQRLHALHCPEFKSRRPD